MSKKLILFALVLSLIASSFLVPSAALARPGKNPPKLKVTKVTPKSQKIAAAPLVIGGVVYGKIIVESIAIYIGICGLKAPQQCAEGFAKAMIQIQKNFSLKPQEKKTLENDLKRRLSDPNDPNLEANRIFLNRKFNNPPGGQSEWCRKKIKELREQGKYDVADALAYLCGLQPTAQKIGFGNKA